MDRRVGAACAMGLLGCGSVDAARLVVRVDGIRDTAGRMVLHVHDSGASIAKGKPKIVRVADAAKPMTEFVLPDLPAGRWALVVFQDFDRNGAVTHGWNRIPKEPMAFSNGFRPGLSTGIPKFQKLAIEVKGDVDTIRLHLDEVHLFAKSGRSQP